ncbi:DNA-binding transcriptional LysR family regulator [Xanthomonas arboricola]|uniref:LysR family transcriptional regulator n=1 Tax=Xanthomonas sp. 3793 TaxID=3035312 RepID=UPI00216776EC|nr:LysR family transcriptional regulator [Xanthomonas sp. 3793]MCS3747267.1 DNA-binding transcriptional LysR family regulator [Xanthomonas sp. 3793]
MFDLQQLRCFVAVADELHFRRAAERLNMTQPPLSRQIQLLEHSVGTALLERNSRHVRLTQAGRSLLAEARAILRMAENAGLRARRIGTGDAGSVSVGFTAGASYRFLPEAIARWRRQAPDVDLQLKEMVSLAQLDALDAGRLDIGLLRPPIQRQGLHSRCVAREPLIAALPEDSPLAHRDSLRLQDFHGQPLVNYAPDEARYFYDLLAQLFGARGIAPRSVQYVSQIHSVLALVRGGMGMALVPEGASGLRYAGIVYLPLRDEAPATPVELHLVWKQDNDNPALRRLIA